MWLALAPGLPCCLGYSTAPPSCCAQRQHLPCPNAPLPPADGDQLFFWSWKDHTLQQTINLGPDGLIPLEVRFLHDPFQPHGFVGAALSSNVIHFTKVIPTKQW